MTPTAIARKIGVHRSTVCREIRRNCDMRGHHKYDSRLAQKKADKRMKDRPHVVRFTEGMKQEARKMIVDMDYSPEQVAGRFRMEGKAMVSHETLYQWIWECKRHGDSEMAGHLRHNGRHYAKRGNAWA